MNFPKEEQLKSEIRTSLSIIRFIVREKKKALGKKDACLIDEHIVRVLEYTEKLKGGIEENKE